MSLATPGSRLREILPFTYKAAAPSKSRGPTAWRLLAASLCTLRRFPSTSTTTFPSMDQAVSTLMEIRSEEHTSELQSHFNLVCPLLLAKKKTYAKDT